MVVLSASGLQPLAPSKVMPPPKRCLPEHGLIHTSNGWKRLLAAACDPWHHSEASESLLATAGCLDIDPWDDIPLREEDDNETMDLENIWGDPPGDPFEYDDPWASSSDESHVPLQPRNVDPSCAE